LLRELPCASQASVVGLIVLLQVGIAPDWLAGRTAVLLFNKVADLAVPAIVFEFIPGSIAGHFPQLVTVHGARALSRSRQMMLRPDSSPCMFYSGKDKGGPEEPPWPVIQKSAQVDLRRLTQPSTPIPATISGKDAGSGITRVSNTKLS
jgi:hypothetical protein